MNNFKIDINLLAGICSGVLVTIAYFRLIQSSLSANKELNPSSWLIWSVNDSLILISQYVLGVRTSIFIPLCYAFLSWACLIISLKQAWKLSKLDLTCLVLAVLAWLLWQTTGNPMLTLILSLVVNIIGVIPTVNNAYHFPNRQDQTAWQIFCLASIINLFAINSWHSSHYLFPICTLICNSIIYSAIKLGSKNIIKNLN